MLLHVLHVLRTSPRHPTTHRPSPLGYERCPQRHPPSDLPLGRCGALRPHHSDRTTATAATRATDQDDAGLLGTETNGYTMVSIDAGYVLSRSPLGEVTLFARGTNLADASARRHTSFVKNLAKLPGVSGLVGVRIGF